jgi:hypothetical protein
VCAKIKAKHPDILERRPDGLYRFLAGDQDMREALFDYLACDRVAAWAKEEACQGQGLGAEAAGGREILTGDAWCCRPIAPRA